MSTLFEKLGGRDAVNAAVDIFYTKVLADQRINKFFENTDMAKQ
ncbi:MAG: group 1 truncated hemoglobin, partial [Halobacteriovoraceae bacterium]|nr:group 1 truncated hemoglobin [Halobacteriovoraceae bacterium]